MCLERGGIAPRIHLGTRWRRVFSSVIRSPLRVHWIRSRKGPRASASTVSGHMQYPCREMNLVLQSAFRNVADRNIRLLTVTVSKLTVLCFPV